MESLSNPSSDEDEIFFDASDEFLNDCLSTHVNSDSFSSSREDSATGRNLRQRKSIPGPKLKYSDSVSGPPSSFLVEKRNEHGCDHGSIENDGDVIEEAVKDRIDPIPAQEKELGVIHPRKEKAKDVDVIDSGQKRVDMFQVGKIISDAKSRESAVTTASDERHDDSIESTAALREPSSTALSYLVDLTMKTIRFQFNFMVSLITFLPGLLYRFCIFVLDPFGTLRRSKRYLTWTVAKTRNQTLNWLRNYRTMFKIVFRFGWSLFWAIYVGILLVALLVSALVLSGFVITHLAEEPLVIKENLNFDYTKNSPEAYVPIITCSGVGRGESCKENLEFGKIVGSRIIPRNRKVEIVVSLTMPESEYNRNLGMFQVRVDFQSQCGRALGSLKRPCMLKFRSGPIRLVKTLLGLAPLVTGYVSETQTLNLSFRALIEEEVPTCCVKVMIEQRAEFNPGAGIPELYDASIVLRSDLSFFKRLIWNWRKTLFVWISMSFFIIELLSTLVCCFPLIFSSKRHRN